MAHAAHNGLQLSWIGTGGTCMGRWLCAWEWVGRGWRPTWGTRRGCCIWLALSGAVRMHRIAMCCARRHIACRPHMLQSEVTTL